MKKKWITILTGALFFSAAGAFYYEGRPDPASANEEQIKAVVEQASKENEAENAQESKESIYETTTDQPSGNEENTEEEKEVTAPAQVKQPEEKNTASKPDTIKLDGYTYHLIEETEYPNLDHLIDASAVINASLYGIKNSDVFILVVDGKVIGGFSVGVLSIEPEYKEYAIERLSYYQDKGLKENIDLTIRTGAKVEVEFPQEDGYYYYYSIELSEGRLIFHYT